MQTHPCLEVQIAMTAMEPLCCLIGVKPSVFTKKEIIWIEAELFVLVLEELKEIFKIKYKEYLNLTHVTNEKENIMFENQMPSLIINDILLTEEYNLQGIAYYTDTFEEVIEEIMTGRNKNPSAIFIYKLINLHRTVRRDLYDLIKKKLLIKLTINN